MNERIRQLADEADKWSQTMTWSSDPKYGDRPVSDLFNEKFAELVAEHEREQCAQVCEAGVVETTKWDASYWNRACEDAAFRIRARGEK